MRSIRKTALLAAVVAATVMSLGVASSSYSAIDRQPTIQPSEQIQSTTTPSRDQIVKTAIQPSEQSIPFTEDELFTKLLELQEQRSSIRNDLRLAIENDNESERLMNQGRLYELDTQIAQLDAILHAVSPITERVAFEVKSSAENSDEVSGISLKSIIQEAYAVNPWTVSDYNYGCDGYYQSWIAQGEVSSLPTNTFHMSIDYPSSISVGLYPFCTGTDWDSFGFAYENLSQNYACEAIPSYQVFHEDDWDAICPGKYIESGDYIVIYTTGNYGLWGLPNQWYWTASTS